MDRQHLVALALLPTFARHHRQATSQNDLQFGFCRPAEWRGVAAVVLFVAGKVICGVVFCVRCGGEGAVDAARVVALSSGLS